MLIVCPSCATSYDVKPASLPPQGRQVRCLRCQAVWLAEPSQTDKLLAAVAAIAPDHSTPGGAEAGAQRVASFAEMASAVARSDRAEELPADRAPNGAPFAAVVDEDGGAASAAGVEEMSLDAPRGSKDVDAPPLAPVDLDEGRPPVDMDADQSPGHGAVPAEDIETVAARRRRRGVAHRTTRWPLSPLHSGILALLLVDTFLFGWRNDIVSALPQTASFYAWMGVPVNLRGLAFDGVVTTTEQHEGVPILVVDGSVVNTARKTVDVPRLKFVVRNAARQEIYSWTAVPTRTLLPPGEAVAFRTRLASPPPDAHDLILRFVNRRDLMAGTH
jgi:predicted Zn finger-like uncharacterized protein